MNDRSIRDIVLSIEKSVKVNPTQLKISTGGKYKPREKAPLPLTDAQRDIIEIVYDSISKPFGITEFTKSCMECGVMDGVIFFSNGDTNRSIKAWLCERMGMKVKWRSPLNIRK